MYNKAIMPSRYNLAHNFHSHASNVCQPETSKIMFFRRRKNTHTRPHTHKKEREPVGCLFLAGIMAVCLLKVAAVTVAAAGVVEASEPPRPMPFWVAAPPCLTETPPSVIFPSLAPSVTSLFLTPEALVISLCPPPST